MCIDSFVLCFSATMGALYEQAKDEDGFLYVAYSGENTFGFQKGPIQTQPYPVPNKDLAESPERRERSRKLDWLLTWLENIPPHLSGHQIFKRS